MLMGGYILEKILEAVHSDGESRPTHDVPKRDIALSTTELPLCPETRRDGSMPYLTTPLLLTMSLFFAPLSSFEFPPL